MFAPTTEQLLREIDEAEKVRDERLRGVNGIIREYVGRWYQGGRGWAGVNQVQADADNGNPEPFAYAFVSNMLPALVYENPSCVVKARRVIGHKEFEEAMQSGVRAWIDDTDYKQELSRAILDSLFFQGILMHYIEDDTRWAAGAVRPAVKRIDFTHWGADALATNYEEAEFAFHHYFADFDDVIEDPDLDPAALELLQPTPDSSPGSNTEPFKNGSPDATKRRRLQIYSVWLRRSNTLRVLCKDPRIEIYPERPYYGPECGPYSLFQAYPVPGQLYPLSPLVAVHDQVVDLQTHAKATARSAAGRKSIILVDGQHGELAEDVKNAEDREVIVVNNFNSSQYAQVEFGGASDKQYEYLALLRDRLDRHSGLTETFRGNVSGGTATESQIANEALNARTEYLKSKVRDATAKALHAVGWFLFHTPGIIIPVNRRDPMTGLEFEGLFFGGQFPGEDAGSWSDYSLKIEPLSMQRVTEQVIQRRAMDMANFVTETAPLIPAIPYVRWQEIYRMVGEAMNQDNTESLIAWELLGQMPRPDLMAPSGMMGPDQPPGQRYSVPGPGHKPRPGDNPNSNAPMVDERRAEMSKPYGDQYGGTQGPPGSARV